IPHQLPVSNETNHVSRSTLSDSEADFNPAYWAQSTLVPHEFGRPIPILPYLFHRFELAFPVWNGVFERQGRDSDKRFSAIETSDGAAMAASTGRSKSAAPRLYFDRR